MLNLNYKAICNFMQKACFASILYKNVIETIYFIIVLQQLEIKLREENYCILQTFVLKYDADEDDEEEMENRRKIWTTLSYYDNHSLIVLYNGERKVTPIGFQEFSDQFCANCSISTCINNNCTIMFLYVYKIMYSTCTCMHVSTTKCISPNLKLQRKE